MQCPSTSGLVTYCAKSLLGYAEEAFAERSIIFSDAVPVFCGSLSAPALELAHKVVFVAVSALHADLPDGEVC